MTLAYVPSLDAISWEIDANTGDSRNNILRGLQEFRHLQRLQDQ